MPDLVLDLFAGPGGWSEGLRMLGLRDVGVEFDTAACQTRRAAGHLTVQADVAAIPVAPIVGKVRGFIASPPCQAWSRAGKRLGLADQPLVHQAVHDLSLGRDTRAGLLAECKDPRSLLAAEPMRYIEAIRPEWITLEEVPDVLPLFRHYAEILRGWGYSVWVGELNAADYGVPQTRRRAILIASRVRAVTAPEPTHAEVAEPDSMFGPGRPGHITMAQALTFEPGHIINTRGNRQTPGGNEFSADRPSWALTEKARSWWVLRQGKRSKATVRRLDQPAATLVAGHARCDYQWVKVDGRDDLGHRQLSIPEAATLHSFPAGYPFQGSDSQRFLQVANAVPPLLAAHVVSAATGIPLHVPAASAA